MRLPRRLAGLILAAGTLAGVTAAAVPAQAQTATPYVDFRSGYFTGWGGWVTGGLCLTAVPGPDFMWQVATMGCNPANVADPAQQWLPVFTGGGMVKFVNQAVGWCLYTDTHSNGSPIALWDCSVNISNTRWAWGGTLGLQTLESRISGTTGHCLDIPGGQFLAGRWTQLWGCNGTAAQKFIIAKVLLP